MTHVWRSLPDRPLDGEGEFLASDAGRLRPLAEALECMLVRWLGPRPNGMPNQRRRSNGPAPSAQQNLAAEASRVGVFGGLGQGKTSAVREACRRAKLHWRYPGPLRRRLLGEAIEEFDVASYKEVDLEWRFFTAVLLRRVVQNAMLAIFLSTLALLVLVVLLTHLPPADRWALARAVAAVSASPLLAVLLVLLASGAGVSAHLRDSSLHASLRDRSLAWLGRWLLALPRVVIVDDLDRASVGQQRTFLRALRRLSLDMGFAVVVCMDETELLNSPHDPESPEQLLRKTLEVELHVPDRSREDVIVLVLSVCKEATLLNPRHAHVLSHAQWLGDLVRVLLLMAPVGRIGPRLVKRLLNDTGQHASTLQGEAVDDWCALLRLEALYRTVPELRRYADDLRRVLESNRAEEFDALLDRCLGSDDGRRSRTRVQALFDRTRAMQPQRTDGWFLLLAGHGLAAEPASGPGTPVIAHDLVVHDDLFAWTRLYAEGAELQSRGYGARLDPSSIPSAGGSPAVRRERLLFQSLAYSLEFELRDLQQLGDPRTAGAHRLLRTWWQGQTGRLSMHALAHGWLCWMAVLVRSEPATREALFACLWNWSPAVPDSAPAGEQAALRRLVMREHAADGAAWRSLVERNDLDPHYRRCLFAAPVGEQDLGAVALGLAKMQADRTGPAANPGPPRTHDREMLHLVQPVRPAGLEPKLRRTAFVADDLPRFWPPGVPGTGAVSSHGLPADPGWVMRELEYRVRIPDAWLHAWHVTARMRLSTRDCLLLLHGAAGWDLDRMRPWIQDVARLPAQLLLVQGPLEQWTGMNEGGPTALPIWLSSIAVAVAADWVLNPGLVAQAQQQELHVLADTLRLLLPLLSARQKRAGLADGDKTWVVSALRRLLPYMGSDPLGSTSAALPRLLVEHLGQTGHDILTVVGLGPVIALPKR